MALCTGLVARHILPVMAFSEPLAPEMNAAFRAAGAVVTTMNYGRGMYQYFRALRTLVRAHRITAAHIVFFDYFSAVPWIARCAGIRSIVYEQQNSGMVGARSWRKPLLRVRTRLALWPTTLIIAISQFVSQQLRAAGVPAGKIAVRYLGVDTTKFTPDETARQAWATRFGIAREEVILATVAYLRPFKNPQVLVSACSELAKRKLPFRLLVAGDGVLLPSLQRQAAACGIASRVHWLGDIDNPQSLLQAADVFLLASVGEAFGLVLAEAMACGVPVVGSRSGSIGEVVRDGETGLLAIPLNARSFADAIERLARQPALRREMGRRSRARIGGEFTVARAVDETLRLYERHGIKMRVATVENVECS